MVVSCGVGCRHVLITRCARCGVGTHQTPVFAPGKFPMAKARPQKKKKKKKKKKKESPTWVVACCSFLSPCLALPCNIHLEAMLLHFCEALVPCVSSFTGHMEMIYHLENRCIISLWLCMCHLSREIVSFLFKINF